MCQKHKDHDWIKTNVLHPLYYAGPSGGYACSYGEYRIHCKNCGEYESFSNESDRDDYIATGWYS